MSMHNQRYILTIKNRNTMICLLNTLLREGSLLLESNRLITRLLIVACIILCMHSNLDARQPRSNAGSDYPRIAGEVIHPVVQYAGSPYLFDQFAAGTVIMLSGEEIDVDYLRYNALTDDLVWMQPGEAGLVRIDKGLLRGFFLEHPGRPDSLMVFYRNEFLQLDGYGCRDCFLQVLVTGDYSLYSRRLKRISSQTEMVVLASGESARMRILQDDHSFLLVDTDNKNRRVGKSTRTFVNAFHDQRRLLRRAMRRANVSINSEKELVDAVRWLNEHGFE